MHRSQRDFKKGENMSIDINKMESFLQKVKETKSPRWASRKMLVTLSLIGGLVWLFKGSLSTILWQVTLLAGLWLVCTTVTDLAEKHYGFKMRSELLKELAKDGLTKEEAEIVEKS
jgi:hypothetical protein